MLTESECKQSLRNLENINLDIVLDELGYEKAEEVSVYGINDYPTLEKQGDIDVLRELIKEHFSNPPLKFDELNKGYPIYDNDEIVCGWKFIYMIDKEYKQLLLIDEEGNVNWVNYEENRFYRKEVWE